MAVLVLLAILSLVVAQVLTWGIEAAFGSVSLNESLHDAMAVLLPFVAIIVLYLACLETAIRAWQMAVLSVVLRYIDQAIRLDMPLPQMLKAAARSEPTLPRETLKRMANRLERGDPLFEAFRQTMPGIPSEFLALIAAGEKANRLPCVLSRLANRHDAASRRANRSWSYLYVVMIMIFLVFLFMSLITPKLEKLHEEFEATLPATTAWLMQAQAWFGQLWSGKIQSDHRVLVCYLALVFFLAFMAIPPRRWMDGLYAAASVVLPWLDRFWIHGDMGNVMHLLGDALRDGEPLPETLQQVKKVPRSRRLRRCLGQWQAGLQAGHTVPDAARQAGMPALLVGMLAPAQATPDIHRVFVFLAGYYDSRFSRTATLLRATIGPACVLAVGLLVGWLALAMFQPFVQLIHAAARPPGAF